MVQKKITGGVEKAYRIMGAVTKKRNVSIALAVFILNVHPAFFPIIGRGNGSQVKFVTDPMNK